MHNGAREFVAEMARTLAAHHHILELGSRWVNGGVRDLFPGTWYLGIDLRGGKGVDVVADATTYTPPSAPDTVLCLEVLEHTPEAALLIANVYRILAPGGCLLATMATDPRPPHGVDGGGLKGDEFYRNVDPVELAGWLEAAGFTTERVSWQLNTQLGDLYVVAWKEPGGWPTA